jgi:hypothetical protein
MKLKEWLAIDQSGMDICEMALLPTEIAPKRTVKAYKLFKIKGGKLYPLYVLANEPVPLNKWIEADIGEMKDGKVKSKLGPLAFRPGWHSGDMPMATHIGGISVPGQKGGKPDYRPDDQVWAEIEVPADVDWQEEANKRAKKTKDGKIVPRTAQISDQVPKGGFYKYKTNSNMTGTWLISGAMKVIRVLSDDEVTKINKKFGVSDLPRLKDRAL